MRHAYNLKYSSYHVKNKNKPVKLIFYLTPYALNITT